MKLSAEQMTEILELAQENVDLHEACFGYDVGRFHFFVYVYYYNGKYWWDVEPNELDEDGTHQPIGEVEEVKFKDYARLLIACEYLAETYFKEE